MCPRSERPVCGPVPDKLIRVPKPRVLPRTAGGLNEVLYDRICARRRGLSGKNPATCHGKQALVAGIFLDSPYIYSSTVFDCVRL